MTKAPPGPDRAGLWWPDRSRRLCSGRLGAQALLHEGLALVALECLGLRIGIAALHLVLLRHRRGRSRLGAQAVLHEGLALVALLVAGVLVAGGHLALLRGRGLVRGVGADRETGTQNDHREKFLHGVVLGDGSGRKPRPRGYAC